MNRSSPTRTCINLALAIIGITAVCILAAAYVADEAQLRLVAQLAPLLLLALALTAGFLTEEMRDP